MATLVPVVIGCDGGGVDLDAEASDVLESLGVSVERPPARQRSKDVEYVAADGTLAGREEQIIDSVATTLADEGWDVGAPAAVLSPAGEALGTRLVAHRGELAVQVLVAARLGTVDAPSGRQWVQLSMATEDERLAWTVTTG